MAIYSGNCSNLVLVECDDDDGTGNFSLISLTGRTPGEVIYVNTFEFENNAFGNYQIAAYDCSSTTPAPTGNTTQGFCSDATIGDLFVNGTAIKWYDAATSGNLLLLTDVIVSNTTYYASQTINCESFNRTAVLAIISSAPIVNNSTLTQCDDNDNSFEEFNLTLANATISSTLNNSFTYFVSMINAESNTSSIINPTNYVNTTNSETIYVRVENQYGCYSIAELNLIVTTTLAPTGAASQSYCNGTIASLQAVGNDILWYDSILSTTPLATTTLLIESISYFASQNVNGCESGNRLEVVYTSNCPTAGCLNDIYGQYPTSTFVPLCSGNLEVITAIGYTSEYSLVTVTSGIQYTFKTSNTSAFITIGNNLGTLIYTSGTGSLNWVSTLSGNVRFYTHLSIACDGNDIEIGRAIQCGIAPTPPSNDECLNAFSLIPGGVFNDYPLIVSNIGATDTTGISQPICGNYFGGDIWYSVLVPASGSVTIQTNTNDGSVTDTVIEVYSGDCLNLTSILCNDDTNLGFSSVPLTGLLAGSTLYVRTFSFSNIEVGTYTIAAFDASLSTSNFDNSNFKFYPNPVNDILTISNNDIISKVQVINLLGQEIFSKPINSTEGKIDMSSLPIGTYLVKVSFNDLVKIIKIIKQ